MNAVKWAKGSKRPWKVIPEDREVWDLCLALDVSLKHVGSLAKSVADFFAKLGTDREQAVLVFCRCT